MNKIIGFIGIIVGIFLGLYMGLYVCFIGGIIDVVNGLIPLSGAAIAFGVVKIMFAGLVGYISAIILIFPSLILMNTGNFKRKK